MVISDFIMRDFQINFQLVIKKIQPDSGQQHNGQQQKCLFQSAQKLMAPMAQRARGCSDLGGP